MYDFYRSELENLANNSACDVIGLVTFVGRVERVKSKGNKGKKVFCLICWTSFLILIYWLTMFTFQVQINTGRIAGSMQ